MDDKEYDIVIIGGGLGGLLCGSILSKEGKNVCVLERDRQFGGCLQTFSFRKKVFESCVHYIGGLGEGHTLHQVLKYAGAMDKIKLQGLDRKQFDSIVFSDAKTSYPIGCREHFVDSLLPQFPTERIALENYIALIDTVAADFPLYNLRSGGPDEKGRIAELELSSTIAGITSNPLLQKVLAGNNLLYAGIPGHTPFYVHALVTHSYLHSVHKVVPGSSEISKALVREIRANGGNVLNHMDVISLTENADGIEAAVIAGGEHIRGKCFISAIHPSELLLLTNSKTLRPAYRNRTNALPNSPPAFMVNVVLKPGRIPYKKQNIYWHPNGEVFPDISQGKTHWPPSLALFFTQDAVDPAFADTVSILGYDYAERYRDWESTTNRQGTSHIRGEGYNAYKDKLAQKILGEAGLLLPALQEATLAHSTATPLSFRDYLGAPNGTLYGIMKDVTLPAQGTMGIRTRIPNLLLTGQNVNMHGILGVSMTAVATSSRLVGMEHLLAKIKQA